MGKKFLFLLLFFNRFSCPWIYKSIVIDFYTTHQFISTKKRKAVKFALAFGVVYLWALLVIYYFHELSSGFYRQREIVITL